MTISNAQFAHFLRDTGRRKVILCEFNYIYQVGVADSGDTAAHARAGTLFLSDYPFNSKTEDQATDRKYLDCIIDVPTFSQSLDQNTLGGQTNYTIGEMLLANDDGRLDYLLDLIVDGRFCALYIGDPSWRRIDFRQIMSAVIQKITAPQENRISFALRDPGYLLNTSIVGHIIGGTTSPNAQKSYPLPMGFCNNVDLVLIDSANLLYGVCEDAFATPLEVYDSGYPLSAEIGLLSALGSTFAINTGTDTLVQPDLLLSVDDIVTFTTVATMGLTSGAAYFVKTGDYLTGTYTFSSTRGGSAINLTAQFSPGETVVVSRYPAVSNIGTPTTVTLAHPPAGRVTCDITRPVLTDTRASYIMQAVAGFPVTLLPSYTRDDDACDFHLGVAITDRRNRTDVLDDIAGSVNGFYGFDQFAHFILGRIRPQGLDDIDSVLTITEDDIIGDVDSIAFDKIPPSYKDARGLFQKSWASQTDGFVSGVTLDRVNYLQAGGFTVHLPAPDGDSYLTDPSKYHLSETSAPDYVTMLSQETCLDAYNEMLTWAADRRDMLRPHLETFACKVGLYAYGVRLGDVVTVKLARFGLSAGEKFQVLSINVAPTDGTIELRLLRRRIGAYTYQDIYAHTTGGYDPSEETPSGEGEG